VKEIVNEDPMTATRKTENGRSRRDADAAPKTLEECLSHLAQMNEDGVDLHPLAQALLRDKFTLEAALGAVREKQEALRHELQTLTTPQHFPAIVTDVNCDPLSVEVASSGLVVRVAVHPDVPRDLLRVGARGILNCDRNCLLRLYTETAEWKEVGTFEGYLDGRKRAFVRHHEEMIAVTLAEELGSLELKQGDLIGFDREGTRMAFARVELPAREDLFFEDTPPDRFEELGGLDREIALLQRVVRFRLQHPELATRYRLPAKRGILLEGPPGNGKTKLARCLARFIAELVPSGRCRFMAVSGSSDYSMWLGQSEQKIIARFDAARELAKNGDVPVVMFFDEVDAIGRRRGSDLGGTAPDRILATFLAQLDGIKQMGNLIVVGATNRADVLDNGLLRPGRLGDVRLRIPSPNRPAARAILNRYLDGLPIVGDAGAAIEAILSRIFSPRGDFANLARITLRDGRKVAIGGRDLVSGALFENVVRVAAEEAADREATSGAGGITEGDLGAALERELCGIARVLTAANVRSYTSRLPQEVDPVAVEGIRTI
jgi:proteasome-associated ATPase